MSPWRVARLVTMALNVVVLVVSGAYLILYLYRWEWNRAVVSGLFFVAALVTFSAAVILRSLARLTDRLDDLERERTRRDGLRRGTGATIADANARAAGERRFAWLEQAPDGPAVFVPVLLGTGVLLSFVAWVLERLAGAFAGGTLDRRTAALLAPDLPLGSGPVVSAPRRAGAAGGTRLGRVIGWTVAAATATVLLAGAVDAIRDATMSPSVDLGTAGATSLVLIVEQKGEARSADVLAESLWTACRVRLPEDVELTSIGLGVHGEVTLQLNEALGDLGRRRFFGCLEDFTLDLVRADVRSWTVTPG
jgi:hypothetical protein